MTTPFTVGELVAGTLDQLINAAAGHLGEPLPDGRRVENPQPLQAWLAIASATALLERLAPLMDDEAAMPFRAGLLRVRQAFSEQHGELLAAIPRPGVSEIVRTGLSALGRD